MAIKTSFARWVAGTALSAVGLWSVPALAVAPPPVPATLTQQGRILDSTGTPVSSKVAITFTIYDSATATAAADALWTETQNITLDDGYFSAQLGSGAMTAFPAGLFSGATLYLGVTVGSDAEMTPRETISSVPYAILAGTALTAVSAPFTGLTGIPAACPAGEYLTGFTAMGAATCVALPALKCHTVRTDKAGVTSSFAGCDTGQITGGGCSTSPAVALTSSWIITPAPCTGTFCLVTECLVGSACTGDYSCNTVSATTITAIANCCELQ